MKNVLTIMLYPFAMIVGALGGTSVGTTDGIRLIKDVVTDRSYDGRELYDKIEHRNA